MLSSFLQNTASTQGEEEPSPFSHLIELWSSAADTHKEFVYSAITAVLALFLKTVSHFIEYRKYGVQLCNHLSQEKCVKIIEKGLNAQKEKDYVISPCLRLLTEIVSFDGGSAARRVFRQREATFKRLSIFLSSRNDKKASSQKEKRRPAVRDNALRYLFANLRWQSAPAKAEILGQGQIIRAWFENIQLDSAATIRETINVVNVDVLQDENLLQRTKSMIFTDRILSFLAKLYSYNNENTSIPYTEPTSGFQDVPSVVHALLVTICTNPEHGILVSQNACFVPASNESTIDTIEHDAFFSIKTQTSPEKPQSQTQIRNTVLASFLQGLRPYADILQRDLVLAVFQAAPELICDYFTKKRSFSFEPNLTVTWVGYSSFLLSVIQLPMPACLLNVNDRARLPPPTSDLIDWILPQVMTQKIATRCLNQKSHLITFCAVRILVAAFHKLQAVLECLRKVSRNTIGPIQSAWEQAHVDLSAYFCQRSPEMRQIMSALRSCDETQTLLQEAVANLLLLYFKVLPQIALEEKIDISVTLSTSIENESHSNSANQATMRNLYLRHLLEIGGHSPTMKWWHKPGNRPRST